MSAGTVKGSGESGGFVTSGYTHPSYAKALSEFGRPRELPRCGGWLLERTIPESDASDAMGCYPLFACADWPRLGEDLEELEGELVSLALVADPFGEYEESDLRRLFDAACFPFKEHFVADLRRSPEEFLDAHHRRNARRAVASGINVEACVDPSRTLDDWCALYANLTERHSIRGLTAFSRESFAAQLQVPGLTALRASLEGKTVGMNLWYESRGVGYYHLGAYSNEGYELRASFALFRHALSHFADAGLAWLSFGAGAGLAGDAEDGLSRFKRGWSTETRTAYFCGRVFDRRRYEELSRARGIAADTRYFPAYRTGEFG